MSSATTSDASILLVLLITFLLFCDTKAEWVETAKLTDIDGEAYDHFGNAVAIDNGTLVVGTRLDTVGSAIGSVSIFERVEGEWQAKQKLTASDAAANDSFGKAVAIYNGMVAVEAHLEDDGGFSAGTVYIYGKGGDGLWTERQKLIHSDSADWDYFGWSLATQGNTLIVGTPGSSSAYVYTLMTGIWTQAAKLTDGRSGEGFGDAVAIDADIIVVGAQRDDDMGSESGSTYVFRRGDEDGLWTQRAKLTPSDGRAGDQFGQVVAIERGIVFVSSLNNADGSNVGAVYQFGEEGDTWIQQNKLIARDFEPGGNFGSGLAFRQSTLVIGAYGQDRFSGAIYVFQQMSGVWSEGVKLVANDGAAGDILGWDVAIDDGVVVAGAYGDNSYRGSVRAFEWHASATRDPSEQDVAPGSTQNSGLQPIMIVVFVGTVGIAFLAGGGAGAVFMFYRRKERPAVPNQDAPHNDDRVVFTDDVSELEEPSLGKGVFSVESSAVSTVHSLGVGTASIGHSQQTSVP